MYSAECFFGVAQKYGLESDWLPFAVAGMTLARLPIEKKKKKAHARGALNAPVR